MFKELTPTIRMLAGLVVALAMLLIAQPSFAEKRIALVIGNGKYTQVGELLNPPNDARLIANTLRGLLAAGVDVKQIRTGSNVRL